jgi:endonuclease G
MKKVILILSVLLYTLGFANPIDDNCPQYVIHGAPVSKVPDKQSQYMCKTGYALHYVYNNKLSEYAVEKVTRESIAGNFPRKDEFREDPELPIQYRATLKDYTGSGYDRGHMAPAADLNSSAQAMSESFYLSNMMPQVPGNNRGIWKYAETYTRSWADAFGVIYVITGTIVDNNSKEIGTGVKVPSFIYKIVYVPSTNKSISLLFPNEKLPVEDIPKYIVSIHEIEQFTGLVFLPKLAPNLQSVKNIKANWKEWAGQ